MGFVLDASVTLAWCFPDEADDNSSVLLEKLYLETATVPALWSSEIANVLVSAERRKRITYAQLTNILSSIANLPIKIEAQTHIQIFQDILNLARQEGLTVYDASYLELALTSGLPLATKDKQLQTAAKKLGVECL